MYYNILHFDFPHFILPSILRVDKWYNLLGNKWISDIMVITDHLITDKEFTGFKICLEEKYSRCLEYYLKVFVFLFKYF